LAKKGEKGQKQLKWAKKPIFGILGPFQAPGDSPEPLRRGCFYINPSRRGPVALPEGPEASPAQGRG